MANTLHFSDTVKNAIEIAQSIAKEYSNANFGGAHLLKALLHEDTDLGSMLKSLEKDIFYLRDWADFRIENFPKSSVPVSEPIGEDCISSLFEKADIVRLKLGKDEIDPSCCFAALLEPNTVFTSSFRKVRTRLSQGN